MAAGEVGRVGVAIDSIEDMDALFDGIPLDRVSTSMTINATAIILLALYVAVARRQGVPLERAVGHDSERHPQGIHRARHLHLSAAPLAAHRHRHLRVVRARAAELEHDLDQRVPHPRSGLDGGAGSGVHARQRASPTSRRRAPPGSTSTGSASGCRSSSPRTTTSSRRSRSSARRAGSGRTSCATGSARRIRARMQLRFHTQTAGSTLTAQQPDNNIVRVAIQALAAVLGGTQSLHCNGRDEALALPTEEAARIALRTQQIIAAESGVANTVDPVGGAWAIERRTDEIEREAPRAHRRDRRGRRHAGGHRSGPDSAPDPGRGLRRPAGDRPRRARSSSASIATTTDEPHADRAAAHRSRERAPAGGRGAGASPDRATRRALAGAIDARRARGAGRLEPGAADHRGRRGRARRLAKSPTRCGACSASTVSSTPDAPLALSVEHLRTVFTLAGRPRGARRSTTCRSTIGRGETLGLVGESGSGKSVTALSIIRLVHAAGPDRRRPDRARRPRPARRSTRRTMRRVRGRRIGFVFQEPMVALDPVYTIGFQIAETLAVHGLARGAAAEAARGRAARGRAHPGSGAARARVSASTERRPAPARDDRAGARRRAGAGHRRRADDRARRHRAGRDPRPAARDAAISSTCRCCSSRTTSASSPRWPTASR